MRDTTASVALLHHRGVRPALRAALLVLPLVTGSAAACSDDDAPASHRPSDVVAEDPDSTAGEVLAAGYVADVERDGQGRVLVVTVVTSGESEGPRVSAWRLRDADGSVVDERVVRRLEARSAVPTTVALDDGFLVQPPDKQYWRRLTGDGGLEKVPDLGTGPAAPGDVVLPALPLRLYRPSAGAVLRPLDAPSRLPDGGPVVDDDGRLWVVGGSSRVGAERVVWRGVAGGRTWQRVAVPMPERGSPGGIAVVHGRVVVPVVLSGSTDLLDSLLVRRVDAPATAPWRRVPVRQRPARRLAEVELAELSGPPDGRGSAVLAGQYGARWFVLDLDRPRASWRRVPLPEHRVPEGAPAGYEPEWDLEAEGPHLDAFGQLEAFTSTDLGRTWSEVPR